MRAKRPSELRPIGEIPGPGRHSIVGSILEQVRFDRDPIRHMLDIRQRYGNIVRYFNGTGNLIFAFGPEYNEILHAQTDTFHSRPFVLPGPRRSAQDRLRKSIFSLNETIHRRMRTQLLPAFQRTMLAGYYDNIVDLVNRSIRDWRVGQQRNLHRDMHLLVWGVVRKLLYGLEESEASESLHEAMEHWVFKTFSPWVRSVPLNLPLLPYRQMLHEAALLEKRFLELMRTRRAEGATGADALSALLRLRHDNGDYVSEEELVGHALTLFLVAYETTGNTLAWTLFLLSQHPGVQREMLGELEPYRGAVPPIDRLDKLPVLNGVLKESMRLLPAVPYSRRLVAHDAPLGDYLLPKKTRIIFSHYVTHHMSEIYPEPEAFRPERWRTITPTPAEYMPFGAGLRTCLGSALAQFTMRIAIATIVPRWKLTVVPNARVDRHLGISLGPRDGIPVTLARQDGMPTASPVHGTIHEMVNLRDNAVGTATDLRRAA